MRRVEPYACQRLQLVLTVASLCSGLACAQGGTSAPVPAANSVQTVNVTATRIEDDRRESTSAKFVVTSKDIERFGDQRLADVLNRVPGLSVGGTALAREIRMRGLGNGYTQVLIDGEPVPPSFSLDGLSPSLIERVEVVRAGTSDLSGQGIAGTVNIILKKASAGKPVSEASVALGSRRGLGSGEVTARRSATSGPWAYSLGFSAARDLQRYLSPTEQESNGGGRQPLYAWLTDATESIKTKSAALTPGAQWKADGHQLQAEGFLEWREIDYKVDEQRTTVLGAPPTFDRNRIDALNFQRNVRASLSWKGELGASHTAEVKLVGSRFLRTSKGTLDGESPVGRQILRRSVNSELADDNLTLKASDRMALGESHTLGVGIEASRVRRHENRIQRDQSDTGFSVSDVDEDFTAIVNRWATYVQDEWTISKNASAYVGVRHESLNTDVSGPTLPSITLRSSVTSPTVQLRWKLSSADQLRLSWGRIFKPPSARNLVPRRWVNNENSAANPNFEGNPGLQPELSTNLDLGFERYLADNGFLGANFYSRNIRDVVLSSVFQRDGVWIRMPANTGRARVYGLELEAKGKVKTGWEAAPSVNLRTGLAFNRSRLDSVPGPDNRLSEQPKITGSFGVDLPLLGAWTFGGNFSYEARTKSRTSPTTSVRRDARRTLETYALWKIQKDLTLRTVLTNLHAPDGVVATTYDDGSLVQRQTERRPVDSAVKLKLEARF